MLGHHSYEQSVIRDITNRRFVQNPKMSVSILSFKQRIHFLRDIN